MFNTEEIKEGKKYTGLTQCKVLAINPTGKWLVENKFRREEKEIDYSYSFGEDNEGIKIQIYVQSLEEEGLRGSVDFLIPSKPSVSSSGKRCFVDAFGKSSYADNPEDCEWLDQNTIVHGSNGLADLIKFIRTWTRSKFDNPIDISKYTQNDFSELPKLVEQANKITSMVIGIKCLFGINDKGYSSVYNKAFIRIDSDKLTNLKKALENEFSTFKADYQSSLTLKEYVESTDISIDNPSPDIEDTSLDGSEDIDNMFGTEDDKEDLAF